MGWESIQTFIYNLSAFLVVILLAFFSLRYGLGYFNKRFNRGIMKVVERVMLDPRRGSALYLVQMGEVCYLLGISQGSVSLIKELSLEEVEKVRSEQYPGEDNVEAMSFREIFSYFKKEKG